MDIIVTMDYLDPSRFTFQVNGQKIAGKWDAHGVQIWCHQECLDMTEYRFFYAPEDLETQIRYEKSPYRKILRELIKGEILHSGQTLLLTPGSVP